jgi:hypothetical protein
MFDWTGQQQAKLNYSKWDYINNSTNKQMAVYKLYWAAE